MRISLFLDVPGELLSNTSDLLKLYSLLVVWDDSPIVDGSGELGFSTKYLFSILYCMLYYM